mmetsp:Transcript_51406/g.149306  ORF Transcript_51406/g.149306 Transcript_51406/m.149306 type:complete len:212 (-) Transcript_51406:909-1544(-)
MIWQGPSRGTMPACSARPRGAESQGERPRLWRCATARKSALMATTTSPSGASAAGAPASAMPHGLAVSRVTPPSGFSCASSIVMPSPSTASLTERPGQLTSRKRTWCTTTDVITGGPRLLAEPSASGWGDRPGGAPPSELPEERKTPRRKIRVPSSATTQTTMLPPCGPPRGSSFTSLGCLQVPMTSIMAVLAEPMGVRPGKSWALMRATE